MNILTYVVIIAVVVGAGVLYFLDNETESRLRAPQQRLPEVVTSENQSIGDLNSQNPVYQTKNEVVVDLSGQALVAVPEEVFDATDTEVLNVSNNNLGGALPAEVRQLTKLRILDLSDNTFTGVPAEVGQLALLEVLDLSNNPITGLPQEIGNLKNLAVLDLRGTNYSVQDLDVIRKGLSVSVEIRTE